MLTDYIQAAMNHARYKIVEEDGTYFGEIPECPGVWANQDSLEECRRELQEVLEEWLLLKLRDHDDDIPIIDGIALLRQSSAA